MADFKITLICASVICMIMQLHGFVLFSQIYRRKQENIYKSLLLHQKSIYRRKMKYLNRRQSRRKHRSTWCMNGRSDEWRKNMLSGKADETEWKKNFRLKREDFMELVDSIRHIVSSNPNSPNPRKLDAEKKLAITLYYLKDTGSIRMTANTFGIAHCTVCKIVLQVCIAIVDELGPSLISLPKTEDDMKVKVSEFECKFGMKQAFGCIDGTHIPIRRPLESSQEYYNYKNFFSLSVQAVCDYRGMFMDVDCRWPGSVHDAKVFANSSIGKMLRENNMMRTFQTIGYEKIPNYIIGDPAYPLTPYLMKEYESCRNNE